MPITFHTAQNPIIRSSVKFISYHDEPFHGTNTIYQFLLNKWYFDELYDALIVRPSKNLGLFLWKFFDIKLIDGFGPDGISALIKKCSLKANKFQSGYIYHYAFVMLLGFSALLTFLIIK